MATLSMDNGLSTTTVAELDDYDFRILLDNIGLLERDENFLKAEDAALGSENNREWAEKFVEAYVGEIIIG